MGLPPAYLFVARHGYRLDAADKQWHLTSPTPYDPPLTYSGWQQAQSLGVRIASILRERVREDELAASRNTDPSAKRKRKRYEVVIHSSPFLRCVQTSIAISAGLARDPTPFGPSTSQATPPAPPSPSNGRPRPTVVTDSRNTNTSAKIKKSVLRLDAFLGEWLSPSYFEFITPPPESVMMLASAKADLLRREDYTQYPDFSCHNHAGHQGHLWSPVGRDGSASPSTNSDPKGSNSTSHLQDRSTPGNRGDQGGNKSGGLGYVSPVPHYAISSNDTIPAGYVSHARDACVAVDYQWHSTRSGLDWGDGGTFPEEWAAMHKRFRAGVQNLVDWYSTAETPTRPVTKTVRSDAADDSDDVETEAVVILVSHGAGCNALIGAITHQPVLMDVAMASLTMAVRKPSVEQTMAPGAQDAKPPVHELYDLTLFANTDHLRSPGGTPTGQRPASSLSGALNGIRGRHSSFSTSVNSFSWNDSAPGARNPATSTSSGARKSPENDSPIPRLSFTTNTGGITIGSGVTSFGATRPSNLGRTGSIGLWSPVSTRFEEDEDDEIPILNFSFEKTSLGTDSSTSAPAPEREQEQDPAAQHENTSADGGMNGGSGVPADRPQRPEPEQLGGGTGGLWGQPRPPDDADRLRDMSGSKRRWTVTERG